MVGRTVQPTVVLYGTPVFSLPGTSSCGAALRQRATQRRASRTSQPAVRERERERDISYISHLQTGRTFHEVKTDQISQSRMNPRDLGQGSRWLWGALVVSLLLPGKSCATINKPPQIMKDLNQKMPLKVGSFNR